MRRLTTNRRQLATFIHENFLEGTSSRTGKRFRVSCIHTDDRDGIRVLTIDNPPINALSFALAEELLAAIETAENDAAVRAVIIAGANGFFSGGADINDFLRERTERTKSVRDVVTRIERSAKPYVAAIDGSALGGGFETALACDYRVGTARTKLGLPEIKLGLIPGAGGTQRLPRLIGAQQALELMLKGETVQATRAKELGILDEIASDDTDVVNAAIALIERIARETPDKLKRRVSERKVKLPPGTHAFMLPFVVAQAHKNVPPEDRGGFAAHKLIDAVQAAIELDFPRGTAREVRLFDELVRSRPAQALIHLFFAERELAKIPGLPPAEPREIASAGVVGGGTMGTGIAITFASAGIPVTVVEPQSEQVDRAKQTVFGMFSHQVQRGRLTQEEAWRRARSITFADDFSALAQADIVIEAVFEEMAIKREVFRKLDAIAKPDAILATNTSTLDIDAMANETRRPENVVGTHFFAPANIMKLLEIVRGKRTSPRTLLGALKLAKTLRKVGVVSRNAFGFIGNRMLFDYAREAIRLAEEGATPTRIDAAIQGFGFAMGPFATFDLSGIDVFQRIQAAVPESLRTRTAIIDRLCERKRFGQKTGAGFHAYAKGDRAPIPDPEVERLFAEEAKSNGIAPREIGDDEIVLRLTHALVNEGARLLRDGVALRAGDIDIVYLYGYGFPPHRGGPMWYADELGIANVVATLRSLRERFGEHWEPAPLLADLARSGATLASFSAAQEPAHV